MVANSQHQSDSADVLIVEDKRDLADLYAAWLNDSYETRVAYSGRDAQQQLDETRYDVVLLDRRMPDVSGDELLDTIRDRDLDCRVVMLTAASPDFDVLEMKVDSYVVKPVTRDELRGVIERLLDLSEYQQHVQELYSLLEKRAVLEAEKTANELAASDEFAALKDEIATKHAQSRTSLDAIEDQDFRVLMEGQSPRDPGENDLED